MKRFNIKEIADWHEVPPNAVLDIQATKKGRTFRANFNVTLPVEVWIADDQDKKENAKLLAASDGIFEVQVSVRETKYLFVLADDEAKIFCQCFDRDMTVPKVAEKVLTNPEPRSRGNDDFNRMMMLMKLNDAKRDAETKEDRKKYNALQKEIAKLKKEKADEGQKTGDPKADPAADPKVQQTPNDPTAKAKATQQAAPNTSGSGADDQDT